MNPAERKRLRAKLAHLERQKKAAVGRGESTAEIKAAIADTQRALQRKPADSADEPLDPAELGRAFQRAAKVLLEPFVYAKVLGAAKESLRGGGEAESSAARDVPVRKRG